MHEISEREARAALDRVRELYLPSAHRGKVEHELGKSEMWKARLYDFDEVADEASLANAMVVFAYVTASMQRHLAPETRVYLVAQENFAAIGCKAVRLDDETFAIVVPLAIWAASHQAALVAGSYPGIIQRMGLPDHLDILSEVPTSSIDDEEKVDAAWRAPKSVGSSNEELAHALALVGIVYLFNHEAAHILRGHFFRTDGTPLTPSEQNAKAQGVDLRAVAIEFDADQFAVEKTFEWMFSKKGQINTIYQFKYHRAAALALLALGCWCPFIGRTMFTQQDPIKVGKNYPSTILRLLSNHATIAALAHEKYGNDVFLAKEMEDAQLLCVDVWNSSLRDATGVDLLILFAKPEFIKSTLNQARDIEICRDGMREELQKLAKGIIVI